MTQIPKPHLPYEVPPTFQKPIRPTSVTVIAILVIILSSLGIVCSPFGLLPFLFDMGTAQDRELHEIVYGNPVVKIWTILATVLGWILAVINLWAAISALSLRQWSRDAMIKIAIIQLILLVIGTAITSIFMLPGLLSINSNQPEVYGAVIGGVIGTVAAVVFGAILPICTIIFFRKPHVIEAFNLETNVLPRAR